MIIGMRGHDFGRMQPEALADAIRETGFAATQLAFSKAFPEPAEQYMTPEPLRHIRSVFSGISLPVMGCYVSAKPPMPVCSILRGRSAHTPNRSAHESALSRLLFTH